MSKQAQFLNSIRTNASFLITAAFVLVLLCASAVSVQAQKTKPNPKAVQTAAPSNLPKVTQITEIQFSEIIKKSTDAKRPVLVNFWATWCDPCREEFPDLVKIEDDYRARGLDFVAVSMDEAAELKTTVPRFLGSVKAVTPSYLLVAKDEAAFLESVTVVNDKNDAVVGLPVTVLFDANGKIVYKRSGKIKPEVVRAEIDKLFPAAPVQASPAP